MKLKSTTLAAAALASALLATGCANNPPAGTWEHIGDSGQTLTIEADGTAAFDFGEATPAPCLGVSGEGPFEGEWHASDGDWYVAVFDDFAVEFTFDVWFTQTNFDKMRLGFCGQRDGTFNTARATPGA